MNHPQIEQIMRLGYPSIEFLRWEREQGEREEEDDEQGD